MADPLAPTVPDRPRAEPAPDEPPASEVPHGLGDAVDDADPISRELVRARAQAGLFGEPTALCIGRYRVIERAGAGGMGVVWSAWDPELNRGVALKLASAGDERARARVLDEGRALAKLSHPNVVPIFDVLDAPEGVFLVMELVKGKTLRQLAPDVKLLDLVRAYRQAGEGLAAAHHAGLIHRDFKADNAILGADQRVRVLDFGLAEAVDNEAAPTIAGTPRYMAPEQHQGIALTPAVDQYGLCAALGEAVRARGAVPKWLVPILARGSADRAEDRYRSMSDLVRALAMTPAAKWRQRAFIGGGAVAVCSIVAAFGVGRTRRAEAPCENGAALIAVSWGGEPRAKAIAHLQALASGYAPEASARIIGALDGYAERWVDVHRTACLAHEARSISTAMFDRRDACLARHTTALRRMGELATSAVLVDVSGLVVAARSLPELAACGDDDGLLSPIAPPPAAAAARAAEIADQIARVDVERDAGRSADATRDAETAVTSARALAYEPLIARALVARGRIALSLAGAERGADDFTEALHAALAMGDDALAVEAYARAAYAIATTTDPRPATDGLPLIEDLSRRAGDRGAFARSLLHNNLGSVALARGDRLGARRAFEQARREAQGLSSSAAIELTEVMISLMTVVDEPAEREQLGGEVVAARIAMLGPNHPLTLDAEIARATLGVPPDRVRESLTTPCIAKATLHPQERASILECAYELAWRAVVAGDRPVAAAMSKRVIDSADADSGDSRVVRTARAYLQIAQGDADGAVVALSAIPPLPATAPWWLRMTSVDAALGLAVAHLAQHDAAANLRDLDEAARLCGELAISAPIYVAARLDAVAKLRQQAHSGAGL